MIRRDRLKKRTGGLLAYIRNKLNFTRRRDIENGMNGMKLLKDS